MNISYDLATVRWRKSSYSDSGGGDCVEVGALSWRKSSYSGSGGGECVEIAAAGWRKSTHSDSSGGECVEVADLELMIALRDSKHPDGAVLAVGRDAFRRLADGIRAGQYGFG